MAGRSRNAPPARMRLRSSDQFRWMRLPAELRLMILDAITPQTGSDWASAAAVCKEWQHAIERRRFRRLRLQVPGLDRLERLGARRTGLVRHLSLDIELPTYTCRLCRKPESESWRQANSRIISKALWKLFRILSRWKPEGGLTLELNAFSPSDSDHWFKSDRFVSDPEGGRGNDGARHDERHGWIEGRRVELPPPSAILRLFEAILLHFPQELPRVDVVTCFVVRRQLRPIGPR
ncbi:hypothetical protein VTK73DRAFT_3658 [Phialemonium thermophilum]|uniref:F-box domain-containing protein n=1 Tax=Phialemonium thermophilum TaxID=223376 RepID=A0ABR3VIA8_9PEZI